MKKLLYIAPFCSPSMDSGASQRAMNLLLQLLPCYEISLLTYFANKTAELESWASKKKISLHTISDPPINLPGNSYLKRYFSPRPPGFCNFDNKDIVDAIDRAWNDKGPFEVIYFATQLMGQVILNKRWPCKMILDLYDVYSAMAKFKSSEVSIYRPYGILYRREAKKSRRYEASIINLSDLILATSKVEAEAVADLSPNANIEIVFNGVNLTPVMCREPEPHTVIMIASFHHSINAEGFIWFYKKVWPHVLREKPGAKIFLIGDAPLSLKKTTFGDASVEWIGKVPDLSPYYQKACCAIVPLQTASGIHIKVLEAMARGVPIVSTSMGVKGIEHENTVTVADMPEMFAAAISEILNSVENIENKMIRTRKIIEDHYTWDEVGKKLRTVIQRSR